MRICLLFCLLAAVALSATAADELHMRDGSVIVGTYVGGTDKAVYFQHAPVGADMYPLFMVESVKFNATPAITPGASLNGSTKAPPANGSFGFAKTIAARIQWAAALLLPARFAAQGFK